MKFRDFILIIALAVAVGLAIAVHNANSHEWSSDPETSDWFHTLMQPDNPNVSCCGFADSYLADQFEVDDNGDYIAIITDERDDNIPDDVIHPSVSDEDYDSDPRVRQHRAVGTRIHVPHLKVGCTKPNPTGHGVLFMPEMGKSLQDGIDHSIYDADGDPIIPYCYCPPSMY